MLLHQQQGRGFLASQKNPGSGVRFPKAAVENLSCSEWGQRCNTNIAHLDFPPPRLPEHPCPGELYRFPSFQCEARLSWNINVSSRIGICLHPWQLGLLAHSPARSCPPGFAPWTTPSPPPPDPRLEHDAHEVMSHVTNPPKPCWS